MFQRGEIAEKKNCLDHQNQYSTMKACLIVLATILSGVGAYLNVNTIQPSKDRCNFASFAPIHINNSVERRVFAVYAKKKKGDQTNTGPVKKKAKDDVIEIEGELARETIVCFISVCVCRLDALFEREAPSPWRML